MLRIIVVELHERQRVDLFNQRSAEILEERIANESVNLFEASISGVLGIASSWTLVSTTLPLISMLSRS